MDRFHEITEEANADARSHYEAKRAAMDAENAEIKNAAAAERASQRKSVGDASRREKRRRIIGR